ncbi:MAG: L-lactate permease [Bdellovibrionales bacterium]|nr:L-lactate permease [Bdellovibrionales bacterium]
MADFIALVPFMILFACFALLKMNLLHSSFVALLTCTLFSQTLYHATPEVWQSSLNHTGVFLFEIGLILIGAFFFIEIARRIHILDSMADLIREISDNRIVQGILVTFPLQFMIEGSSGFGTPILMVAPLLRALGFPLILCAILPFIGAGSAVPYGALGTPLRLGFNLPEQDFVALSIHTARVVIPFLFFTPFISAALIHKYDSQTRDQKRSMSKIAVWIFWMSTLYAISMYAVAHVGPEFPTLAASLITFVALILTRGWFFEKKPIKSWRGIKIYSLLLVVLWTGKQIWLEEKIPGTSLRWFNPGWVFMMFGAILIPLHRLWWKEILANTFVRARRTLMVFFCMTWIVQQLKSTGSLDALASALPRFFLHEGAAFTAWFGTIMIGTSTMTNLFLSPLFAAPLYAWLAAGSAIGYQLAFQSITAVRSILHDEIEEREIFKILTPISVGFVLILSLALILL